MRFSEPETCDVALDFALDPVIENRRGGIGTKSGHDEETPRAVSQPPTREREDRVVVNASKRVLGARFLDCRSQRAKEVGAGTRVARRGRS